MTNPTNERAGQAWSSSRPTRNEHRRSADVAVLVGSLRAASLNRRVALALTDLAPPGFNLKSVGFGDLPHYDEELDGDAPPAPWLHFRDRIHRADAVLFMTPEYNRSIPGALKNALDVGSRPYGRSVWGGKPAAVMSTSPGDLGAFGANHHLRQVLTYLNMPTLQQPEAYVGHVGERLSCRGGVAEGSEAFFADFILAFAEWVERLRP